MCTLCLNAIHLLTLCTVCVNAVSMYVYAIMAEMRVHSNGVNALCVLKLSKCIAVRQNI